MAALHGYRSCSTTLSSVLHMPRRLCQMIPYHAHRPSLNCFSRPRSSVPRKSTPTFLESRLGRRQGLSKTAPLLRTASTGASIRRRGGEQHGTQRRQLRAQARCGARRQVAVLDVQGLQSRTGSQTRLDPLASKQPVSTSLASGRAACAHRARCSCTVLEGPDGRPGLPTCSPGRAPQAGLGSEARGSAARQPG